MKHVELTDQQIFFSVDGDHVSIHHQFIVKQIPKRPFQLLCKCILEFRRKYIIFTECPADLPCLEFPLHYIKGIDPPILGELPELQLRNVMIPTHCHPQNFLIDADLFPPRTIAASFKFLEILEHNLHLVGNAGSMVMPRIPPLIIKPLSQLDRMEITTDVLACRYVA